MWLCIEVETAREFTFLGDSVSTDGGCEAAVTAEQDLSWLGVGNVASCCME